MVRSATLGQFTESSSVSPFRCVFKADRIEFLQLLSNHGPWEREVVAIGGHRLLPFATQNVAQKLPEL